jgi:hypothetical protein
VAFFVILSEAKDLTLRHGIVGVPLSPSPATQNDRLYPAKSYSFSPADMRAMKLSNEPSQTRNHKISSLRKGLQLS